SAKKTIKLQNKTVADRKATLTYEGGGQAELALGVGELTLSFSDLPADIKMVYVSLRIPTAVALGAKWSIGGAEAKEFPKDKPPKPFMYQGNAKVFELTSPTGVKTALQLPDYSYQQLQDNREWGAGLFQWQFWTPYYPDNPRCILKIGDAALATATPAAAPAKVAAPTPTRAEPAPGPETGATKILKWQDGKQAVFMLEFDDSCESHIKNVIPELKKRGMVGTFYINPGNGPFKNKQRVWETEVPAAGMELANHTFTHSHALNVADFEQELTLCTDEINKCYPDRKQPRLISYGQPGGVKKEKWLITKDETKASLAKLNLIERPPFWGPPIHQHSAAECLKIIDQALAKGDMGYLVCHGVGGDWLVTPMDWFRAILDKLDAHREQIWITDPISWHKYLTERKAAEVKVLAADAKQIRLQLSCTADPVLYDLALTLATRVPLEWKACLVTQGPTKITVPTVDGVVRYPALPGTAEITLQPAESAR
ncbi:MAG: polysaccharide deacetylase family protein, partial [Kiritimatiellaeota bacterium]|nr:polysaccharide deacetylase family protein [Kiritimatiellota bacterium]